MVEPKNATNLIGLARAWVSSDEVAARKELGDGVTIDTPERGAAASDGDIAKTMALYNQLLGGASMVVVNTIDTAERCVAEIVFELVDLDLSLTLAMVSDNRDGAFSAVRVYHHTAHYKGRYTRRLPMVPEPTDPVVLPKILQRYFHAVRVEPSLDEVMAMYSDDAYLVAPPGMRATGRAQLHRIYSMFLSQGGIGLHPQTATSTEGSCAVEWVCDRWGQRNYGQSHAGLAVYDFHDDTLRAARIYDDLDPPFRS